MDAMFERLNKIFPDSGFVKIEKYDPKLWEGKEYDSHLDFKAPMNKWASNPLDYEEACIAIEEGYRIGWVIPEGVCCIDIDNQEVSDSSDYIIKVLDSQGVKYNWNKSFHGLHLIFRDPKKTQTAEVKVKCGLNLVIDTRANKKGYIVLPVNDPHREWGVWADVQDVLPCYLRPIGKDNTPPFIGLVDGDGRNDTIFKWKTKLTQSKKLNSEEIDLTLKMINEHLFGVPMTNKELNSISEPKEGYKDKRKRGEKESLGNMWANELLSRYDIITMGDQFYIYEDNYYKPISNKDMEVLIHKELGENIEPFLWDIIKRFVSAKTQVDPEDVDKNWDQIACKNGVLNIVAGELTLANKNEFNTIHIPWRWNPDPEPSSSIIEFMAQISGGDANKIQFLYEVAGYCLLKRNLYRKFFIFQGPGGTGKSTFQRLITKLVGEQNCSYIGLNNFDNDYFLAKLVNKLVNLDDDAVDGKSLDDSGRFKSVTAGERITARPIREAPRDFIPFCTCIFNCNKLPRIMDTTTGLYSRIIIVELNNVIKKPIPKFEEMLTDKDMEYFLYKAVKAIGEVIERNGFTINTTSQALLQRFKCRQSAVNEWLFDTGMKMRDVHGKRCQTLYTQHVAWCAMSGYKHVVPLNSFKEEVAAAMGVTVDLLRDGDGPAYFGFFCLELKGLKIDENTPQDIKDEYEKIMERTPF